MIIVIPLSILKKITSKNFCKNLNTYPNIYIINTKKTKDNYNVNNEFLRVHFWIYKLKKKIYGLIYKTYLKEKVYKTIVFVWIDWPIHIIGSIGQPIKPQDWQ